MSKMIVFKYVLLWIISLFALINDNLLNIYKELILSEGISILLATLIAGLFGFIIAVIPFAIQLLNQDNEKNNNKFLSKLMTEKKFNFFIKPMLYRFINILRKMFYLFVFLIVLQMAKTIDFQNISFLDFRFCDIQLKTFFIIIIFYIYMVLVLNFFTMLINIIRDLESLVFDFIKAKKT